MAPTRTAPPQRIGPLRIGPLRIGIVTDGLQERIVDGEVRIANGGVGVYIYQLIRAPAADRPGESVLSYPVWPRNA